VKTTDASLANGRRRGVKRHAIANKNDGARLLESKVESIQGLGTEEHSHLIGQGEIEKIILLKMPWRHSIT
jgi:hypothetical protein